MPLTILVDGNNFAIRLLSAIPGYDNQFLSPHQANLFVHSFLTGLLNITNKVKQKYHSVDNLVIVWDSRINNRKKIYPNYKGNRKPKTEEEERNKINHYSLLDKLRESLKTLGEWSDISLEGYEADDIIAYFIKESTYKNNFIVVSSDNDLFQLLGGRCIMYLQNKKEFYTHLDFQKEFGIISNKYPYVKALAGDRSDNIKGIEGIGIKRGIKIIKEGPGWIHLVDTYKDIIDLETNLKLIELPFEGQNISIEMPQYYFNKESWINLFQTYGLAKLNLSDFKNLINEKN